MAPKVWVTAHSREEGPAALVGNQQVKAFATLLHTSGFAGCAGGGGGNSWVPNSCVPLSGGLCQKQLRVLEGGIHHARLTVTGRREPRRKNQSPAPGLASQTSRCTKKAQSLLSPFSGQSTGRGGCRALLKAGGCEEAGAFSLLVPSLLSLCASSRENRELEI